MRPAASTCALALALSLAGGGCAGELAEPERFTDCAPGHVEDLFQTRCAGMCHAGTDPEAGLDLVSANPGARLVAEVSDTIFCSGRMLIEPDPTVDPSEHLLIDKLSEHPSCGARMPFGGEALSPDEVECVTRWIGEQLGAEDGP
jgi:hypothetical protein